MKLNPNERRSVAYFSMEIGIDERMCTYSGGLGVLAGDTIRSAADLKVSMVAVTLLYRKGYFRQRLEADGWQREEPASWAVEELLQEESPRTWVLVEGRTVHLRAWRYDVEGVGGYTVPIYFLDTDFPENSEWDRGLTQTLYGGDDHYRLSQEAILGIGGVRMLRALGYKDISTFHLNEGHAALLSLELLDEAAKRSGRESVIQADAEAVRNQCVFTTHTPVPAGHDKFPLDLAWKVIGKQDDFFGLEGVLYEGHIEGLTGWSIGDPTLGKGENRDHSLDAPSLYDKLEHAIVPLFYHDRRSFMDIMAYSIAINGSFFNTQRMVQEYVLNAYFNR